MSQETSTYQQQATDFLNKYGISMSAKFVDHKPYFAEDNESRDVFRITFTRDKSKFSLTFGQSIVNSTGDGSNVPTAYDVLACIQKNDPGSFENFCADFGYDSDSRKSERTYRLVLKQWEKVEAFFSQEEIEALQEIA
jgi:hypothetical protein